MEALREEYSRKLQYGDPIKYRLHTYTGEMRDLTLNLVSQYLAQMHLNHLQYSVFTFVNEVINNAVKANLKRLYFKLKNHDPNDKNSYDNLISNFNEEAVANIDEYIPQLKEDNLFVEIFLQQKQEGLQIRIANNTGMLPEEYKRVSNRIESAARYNSVEEAFDHFLDSTEGGGLGLVLNIVLLKKSGIDPSNFKLVSDDKHTVTALTIPARVGKSEIEKQLEEKILKEINMIPTFPETVKHILNMCDDPEASLQKVAMVIERDPALVADILKLANSAAFAHNRVNSLSGAVSRLGLQALKHMITASTSKNLLDKNYKIFQGFWDHSFKCAFYAKKIAEHHRMKHDIETVYIGGLLHDLGKIILYSIDPALMKQINGFQMEQTTTAADSSMLEEIGLGISHAQIGAMVAENWDFSPELVEIIRNHHRPFSASDEYKKLSSIVHIANALCNIETKNKKYVYIDLEAYGQLGLKTTEDVSALHEYLKKEYAQIQHQIPD